MKRWAQSLSSVVELTEKCAAEWKGACSHLNIQQALGPTWKGDLINFDLLIRQMLMDSTDTGLVHKH